MVGRDGVEDGRVHPKAGVIVLVGVDCAHDVLVEALGEGTVNPVVRGTHSRGLAEDGTIGTREGHLGQPAESSGHTNMVNLALGLGVGIVLARGLVRARERRLGDLVYVDVWRLSPDP